MFEQSLLSTRPSRPWTTGVGFMVVMSALAAAVIAPLLAIPGLPLAALRAIVVAPAPPSAPAPSPPKVVVAKAPPKDNPGFWQPKDIPKGPPPKIVDEGDNRPPSIDLGPRVPGGVPCGGKDQPPCGIGPGIPWGINKPPAPLPPPPKVEAPKVVAPQRIRVGGNVQKAMQLFTPSPAYPPLAKQAGVQGVVRLNAVISKDGGIEQLTAVSGHPLLIPAALDAVSRWRYKPTLLNGEPVEVVTQIDVNFTLTR